jgi:transcription elongation factor GreA
VGIPPAQAREGKAIVVSDTQVTWLSREGYDRLKRELDELIAQRPAVAAVVDESRREGDLRENSGYYAALEEQEKQEVRIQQLRALLRNAQVGGVPRSTGVAEPGMVLTVRYEDSETEKFLLATREQGAAGTIDVVSPNSPLGQALLGAKQGETREYQLPDGATMHVTLIEAKPHPG